MNFTFDANEQGFTLGDGTIWTGDDGHGPGCLSGTAIFYAFKAISLVVAANDPFSFWYRVTVEAGGDPGDRQIDITFDGSGGGFADSVVVPVASVPFDSGWVKHASVYVTNETLTIVSIFMSDNNLTGQAARIDSIYLAEAEPGGAGYTRSAGGIPGAIAI